MIEILLIFLSTLGFYLLSKKTLLAFNLKNGSVWSLLIYRELTFIFLPLLLVNYYSVSKFSDVLLYAKDVDVFWISIVSVLSILFFLLTLVILGNIIKNEMLISKISKIKIIALTNRYKDFPKYNLVSNLSNIFTLQIPFFMIPKLFNLSISGYFFFAQKIISILSFLIATSTSQVLFQKVSENIKDNNKNMPIFLTTLIKLIFLSLPISFIVSTLSIILVSYYELKLLVNWQYLYLSTSIIFFMSSYYLKLELRVFLKYYVIHQVLIYIIYICV